MLLHSLQNEGEPNRAALVLYIQKEIQGISDNKQLLEGVEKWKQQLLLQWEPDQTITESLQQLQQKTLDFVDDKDFYRFLSYSIDESLNRHVYKKIAKSIDHWIQKQITVLVENNHSTNWKFCTRKFR